MLPAGQQGVATVETFSPAGEDALSQQVAIDAEGNALVVWSRSDGFHDRIQIRRRSTSGSLSPVQTLSPAHGDAGSPQVAVDAHGNALVVWARWNGHSHIIQLRRRSASGTLSPVQTLSAFGDALDPQLAIDRNGNALVVWEASEGIAEASFPYSIHLRRRSASGILGPIKTLSLDDAGSPQLAIDRNGNALVVWQRADSSGSRIQLRRRSASGTLRPVRTLSAVGPNTYNPQIAIDRNGNALVVWSRVDGTGERIELRRRSVTGALSRIQTVSAAGATSEGPQVAINSNGNALVVWSRRAGSRWRIQARRRSVSGILNLTQTLSPAGFDAFVPQLAFDTARNALVVWQLYDGTDYSIQFRSRAPSGDLGVVQTLSSAGPRVGGPPVAIAARRRALVVWSSYDGTNFRIQAARPAP